MKVGDKFKFNTKLLKERNNVDEGNTEVQTVLDIAECQGIDGKIIGYKHLGGGIFAQINELFCVPEIMEETTTFSDALGIERRLSELEKKLLALQKRELIAPRNIFPSDNEVEKAEKEYREGSNESPDWVIGAAWMKEYIENQMR